jgi:hypothetical protein
MAWYDAAHSKPNAWIRGLAYFGVAAACRSLWNAGLLIVFIIANLTPFALSNEGFVKPISWFGETALISFLAILFLFGLGPLSLWLGRSLAQSLQQPDGAILRSDSPESNSFRPAAAIWAVVSLVIILPIGIFGMRYLL